MGLLTDNRGRDWGQFAARALHLAAVTGQPQMQAGLLAQFQAEAEQQRRANQFRGLLGGLDQPQGGEAFDSATNPPIMSAPSAPGGGLLAGLENMPEGMSGGGSGLLANTGQAGLLTPQERQLVEFLGPEEGTKYLMHKMTQQPGRPRIVEGPGGVPYYETGEPVLPGMEWPKQGGGFTLAPGATRYDAEGNPIVTAPERQKDAQPFVTLTPEEVQQAGFRPGTIAQRDPRTGRIHILQQQPAGSGIRTAQGSVNLPAQRQINRMAAEAFGGMYDPLTNRFSFTNKAEREQAMELAERATAILEQGTENNIAAATRRALQEMRSGTSPRPQTRKPGQGREQGPGGRRRAKNPQTGEVVEYNPDTGQWEPVR